jgi:hypothetical protein
LTTDFILLESGDKILLESGDGLHLESATGGGTDCLLINATDKLLINGTDCLLINTGVVPTTGVDIQGQHATADLRGIGTGRKRKRTLTFVLEVTGKISTIRRLPTQAKVQTVSEIKTKGRLLGESILKMTSRMMQKASVYAEGQFHSKTEANLGLYKKNLQENKKLLKLKRLIRQYHKLTESLDADE